MSNLPLEPPSFKLALCTIEMAKRGRHSDGSSYVSLLLIGPWRVRHLDEVQKRWVWKDRTVSKIYKEIPIGDGDQILWEAYLHGEGSDEVLRYWAANKLLPSVFTAPPTINLSGRDAETLVKALNSDEEPNATLRQAAAEYVRAVETGELAIDPPHPLDTLPGNEEDVAERGEKPVVGYEVGAIEQVLNDFEKEVNQEIEAERLKYGRARWHNSNSTWIARLRKAIEAERGS